MKEHDLVREAKESKVHVKQESTPEIAGLAIEGNGMGGEEGHEGINGSEMHEKEGTPEIAAATEGDEMSGKDGLEINGNLHNGKDAPDEMSRTDIGVDKASDEN
jgi:hypothetical protein